MKLKLLFCALLSAVFSLQAQEYFPVNSGVKAAENTNYTVFKNAKIHVSPSRTIESGMLSIHQGKVVAVGQSISVPENSVVIDLQGKQIYPSFIDVYTHFGIEKNETSRGRRSNPQYEPSRQGYYWNDHIRPDVTAQQNFSFSQSEAENLRKIGFGVVNTHTPDGIIRGTGMLVGLSSEDNNGYRILNDRSAQYLSFDKSSKSQQMYPTSTMGVMALLRQVYHDAQWYEQGGATNKDQALEALNKNKDLVQIFKASDLLNGLRADKVGDEFGIQYVILGDGTEYKKLDEIKNTQATFIVPVDFPEAIDMEDPYLASYANIEELKEWNQAPANLKALAQAEVPFVLTSFGAGSDFRKNLQQAVAFGLDKEKALEALTTAPARLLGQENNLGTLQTGAWANFIITSGDYFDKGTTIYQNWVQGERNAIEDMSTISLNGTYQLNVAGTSYQMEVSGKANNPSVSITSDGQKIGTKVSYDNNWITLLLSSADTQQKGFTRLVAKIEPETDQFSGKAVLTDGTQASFSARKTGQAKQEDKSNNNDIETWEVVPVSYPNKAYGFAQMPEQETILFKNATVWTNEESGILENTDVLVRDGKIVEVGQNLSSRRARVIDATGKHLTPGIIDEHSHVAASSINESGSNSSAEVRMEDVVDPDDINIYRNLAGGVTTMQLLHGSANPIGGQSAILKMKWGGSADDLILDDSPQFIKFALGENVKQSNWDSFSRFPQTRMGVEQVYIDYFTRAKQYEVKKNSGQPYRKDLEMETLLEILNAERHISAHSYVQSEINMLMHVADKMGFEINTFTHILEGYKLADKMKERGIGGSTFSDWWSYKYEVLDAIPQNASIMHNEGVTVAINSDDAEMSRRLNQEAAKSIKYGNVSQEEALKFITLNPAKLLRIDHRVGSIRKGKDADLVLWTDHPLSIYAKADKTLIEGVVYFDLERDETLRENIAKEKSLITNQLLQVKNKGVKTVPAKAKEKEEMHCDTEFIF